MLVGTENAWVVTGWPVEAEEVGGMIVSTEFVAPFRWNFSHFFRTAIKIMMFQFTSAEQKSSLSDGKW